MLRCRSAGHVPATFSWHDMTGRLYHEPYSPQEHSETRLYNLSIAILPYGRASDLDGLSHECYLETVRGCRVGRAGKGTNGREENKTEKRRLKQDALSIL